MFCVGQFLSRCCVHDIMTSREVFMAHYVYVSQKVDSGYVRDPARGEAIWFRVFTKTLGDSGGALG